MFGLSMLKKGASPEPYWQTQFDNTFWSPSFGSWSGTEWVSTSPLPGTIPQGIGLDELGIWVEGFRPTKARLTAAGGSSPPTISLKDQSSNIIGTATFAGATVEMTITFVGAGNAFDIQNIQFTAGDAAPVPFSITNIEFFGV